MQQRIVRRNRLTPTLVDARFTGPEKAAQAAVRLYNEIYQAKAIESAFVHGLAGAGGALLALVIVYPLDNLRAQIQCSKQRVTPSRMWRWFLRTIHNDGVTGLYSGLSSALVGVGVSWAVFYYLYTAARQRLMSWKSSQRCSNVENMLISLAAGATAVIISNPIWVVNTRAKLRQNKSNQSFMRNMLDIIRDEGVEKLFAGIGPSLILLINPAIQFTVYERLKVLLKSRHESRIPWSRAPISQSGIFFEGPAMKPRMIGGGIHDQSHSTTSLLKNLLASPRSSLQRTVFSIGGYPKNTRTASSMRELLRTTSMFNDSLSRSRPKLTATDHLIAGALSKLVALLVTYPLQVVKSRAHARELLDGNDGDHDDSIIRCFFRLIETEGIAGLYRGLGSKVLASTLTAAIMFSFYEQLTSMVRSVSKWKEKQLGTRKQTGESLTRLRERCQPIYGMYPSS